MNNLPFKMVTETDKEKWRAETFWTKEPETIAWIDTFEANDVFFDVGANIGIYSLYAASKRARVYAFEAMLLNYLRLSHNRRLNGFDNLLAYYCAVSDSDHATKFWVDDLTVGSSGGQASTDKIAGMKWDFDVHAHFLDSLSIMHNVTPDHIKIDIDGQERKVLQGMKCLLEYRKFKTCLIEVDNGTSDIIGHFQMHGYDLHPLHDHSNHSRVRRQREGITVENLIFIRR